VKKRLTLEKARVYDCAKPPVIVLGQSLQKTVAGIGVPSGAARAANLRRSCGFFTSRCAQFWRSGREESKDSPVLHRYANSRFGLPPQLALGLAVTQTVTGARTMAKLHRRDFTPLPPLYTDFSFVAFVKDGARKKRLDFFNVKPTDDYGKAICLGHQYACELVQYLKDNRSVAGMNTIGLIALDMAAHREGAEKGYEVGFWRALEYILVQAATQRNHWDLIQPINDSIEAINTARQASKEGAEA